jgi:predicted dehydrogenase
MWELHPRIDVVALADPDEEGRQQRAAEAGVERTYEDYRAMLERERPDFVSVGPRWTIRHKEYLEACAELSAHGIMEKPLAVDLMEADEMLRIVDQRRLKWSMAFNFRASPVIDHARQMILNEGIIGDILEIRSRGKEDRRAGGEDLIVLGVHSFVYRRNQWLLHFPKE